MGHPKVEHECTSRELYFPVADVGHPPAGSEGVGRFGFGLDLSIDWRAAFSIKLTKNSPDWLSGLSASAVEDRAPTLSQKAREGWGTLSCGDSREKL
jgi:hypothetical protein